MAQLVPLIQHPSGLAAGQLGRDRRQTVYVGLGNGRYIVIAGAVGSSTEPAPAGGGGNLNLAGLAGVLTVVAGVLAGGATTTDLPEGASLYFTDERARAATEDAYLLGWLGL